MTAFERHGWWLLCPVAFLLCFYVARANRFPEPAIAQKPSISLAPPASPVHRHVESKPRSRGHDIDLVFDVEKSDIPTDLIEIPRKFLKGLWLPCVGVDAPELSSIAREILDLEESAVTEVNGVIAGTVERLQELHESHGEISDFSVSGTKVVLQAFPTEGETLLRSFEQQLFNLLGSHKSALLKELLESDYESAFLRFGALPVTVEIEGNKRSSGQVNFGISIDYEGGGSSWRRYEDLPHWVSHFIQSPQ